MILSVTGDDLMGRTFLDIGCSTGWFARELAERGAIVRGIDSDQGMIDRAQKYAAGMTRRPVFVLADCRNFRVSPPFNFVLFLSVLHYFKNNERYAVLEAVCRATGVGMFMEFAEHHSNGNMTFDEAKALCLKAGFGEPRILGRSEDGRIVAYFPKGKS